MVKRNTSFHIKFIGMVRVTQEGTHNLPPFSGSRPDQADRGSGQKEEDQDLGGVHGLRTRNDCQEIP